MIMWNQNMGKKQNYITWIQTASYADNVQDIKVRFDNLSNELDRPLPKAKNKKLIGLMPEELSGKIMK